jgi:hypothetical protein
MQKKSGHYQQVGDLKVRWVQRRHRAVWALIAGLLLWVGSSAIVAAAGTQQATVADGPSVWPVLLPMIATAIAVERAIELLWNYLEWILIRFLRWQPRDLRTPSYVQFKGGTSLLFGLCLGILVANFSGLRLLAYLQPFMPTFIGGIPAEWDIILTGVVLGAGAKPVHDLLGIITHLKNLAANSAVKQREQAGAALADGILKLNQTEGGYSVDIPGLGAARITGSAGVARSRMLEDTGQNGNSTERMEQYANVIHNKLYIGP